MNELGQLQDLVIQIHDAARKASSETIARRLRKIADELSDLVK